MSSIPSVTVDCFQKRFCVTDNSFHKPFLRYSYSITVFEKEKALRSFLSLFVPTAKLLQKILLVDFKQGEYEDEL